MCGLSPTRPVRPSDLFSLASVGTLSLHPSGDHVVFSIVTPDEENDRLQSDLFICSHQAHETPTPPRRLTSGPFDTKPRHSPDGATVAFIRRTPNQSTKIMVLEIATRQEVEMASFDNDAAEIYWMDNNRLAVLAPTITDGDATKADQNLDSARQPRPKVITRLGYREIGTGWVENSIGQVHLLTRDLNMWTKSRVKLQGRLASATTSVRAISISPDRRALAAVTSGDQDDDDITGASNLWSIDITSGRGTLLHRGGRWERVLWHSEGHIVAIGNTKPRHVGFSRPYIFDPEQADRPNAYCAIGSGDVNAWPVVQMDRGMVAVHSGVLCLGSRRGAVTIDHYRFEADTDPTITCDGKFVVAAFDGTYSGSRLVGAVSTPTRPAELCEITPEGPVTLISLNDDVLAELELGPTTEVELPGPNPNQPIHALVTTPPSSAVHPAGDDNNADTERPGFVLVHGGPMWQHSFAFNEQAQIIAAMGVVVISPNPVGSDGYGSDWATALLGRLGEIDWADIEAVTDYLAQLPEVDSSRIGIGGLSYGGYMAAWATTRSDRFVTAIVEGAVTSWASLSGTSDIGHLAADLFDVDLNTPEAFDRMNAASPATYASRVSTPTLILHCLEDWRCPVEQAELYFAGLRRARCHVEMVLLPQGDHEPVRSPHPSQRFNRHVYTTDFLNRFL